MKVCEIKLYVQNMIFVYFINLIKVLLKIVTKSKRHLCFIKTAHRATYLQLLWLQLSAALQKSRSEIAFRNKKGLKWALLFLLRTNKEACKITKVPLLSVCKTKKAILPFNHRHKMHVLHPKQSKLAMGSKRFSITWIFPGYKILLWMQL